MKTTTDDTDIVNELTKTMHEFVEISTGRMRELTLAISKANRQIKQLSERVEDLEGHAEHGPTGSCGVCASEESDDQPETVGANEYVRSVFVGECVSPDCTTLITPGDLIVQTENDEWRHRDCN